ncbi:MAG TPA: protein kinase [Rhodanobacteraceae bacterium]|nr:protein kinase [Rhodanobacteraceae bacterium]
MPSQRIDEVFARVLDVAPAARAAWLDVACAGDVALRKGVERLLHYAELGDGVLESAAADIAEVLDQDAPWPARFGVWRVIDRLGAGGMGEVWLAERDDAGFVQQAAIKQVAWPTPGLLRHFERERRILAGLQHPGIARLIDGGTDAEAGPFLAMEYVKGQRIDAWVRERRLDARGTVRLLIQVCEAVQYAHRNLVVHSDIKPSNILIDEGGVARLLDFGIARVLSADDRAETRTAARIMTPEYAAPELLRNGDVTTAVDVYALGVLAYELLVGNKPRQPRPVLAPAASVVPAPSTAISRNDPGCKARRRDLHGDLDRIVLTAMADEPERRYASVDAMTSDLRRWLDGLAVQARGNSLPYRLRKFAARNRVAVAIAGLSVLALIATTGISLALAIKANRQAARAEAVRAFLVDVFARADPTATNGVLSARQLVAQSQQRLSDMKAVPVDVRADLMVMLGQFYWSIADYPDTTSILEAVLAMARHGGISASVHARALVALAASERDRRLDADAWAHLDQAVALLANSPNGEIAAAAQRVRSGLLFWHDGANVAQASLATQIKADAQRFGNNSIAVIDAMISRATALRALARYHEAEAMAAGAASRAAARFDSGKRSRYALAMDVLGSIRTAHGDYAGAETAFQHSREMVINLWGPDNVRTAITESQLHGLDVLRGNVAAILPTLRRDIKRTGKLRSQRADLSNSALRTLGDACLALGRFAEAEASYRGLAGATGRDTPANAQATPVVSQYGLAQALAWQSREGETDAAFKAELALPNRHPADASRRLARAHAAYADFLRRRGRVDAALDEARQAVTLLVSGEDDPERAQALASLAQAELTAGNVGAARQHATQAVAVARRVLPARNWQLAPTLHALAATELASGTPKQAAALAREALATGSPPMPAGDPRVLEWRALLAKAEAQQP